MPTNAPSGSGTDANPSASRYTYRGSSRKTIPRQFQRKKSGSRDVALGQIRKYQKSTELLIPPTAFARLVREIAEDMAKEFEGLEGQNLRFTKDSLLSLQEAAEAHLIRQLTKTQLAALHAKRITITPKDMKLVQTLSEDNK